MLPSSLATALVAASAVVAATATGVPVPAAAGAPPAAAAPAAAAPAGAPPTAAPAVAGPAVESSTRRVPIPGVDVQAARALPARSLAAVVALSAPVPASGYATVGVTWHGAPARGQRVVIRTLSDQRWTHWQELHVDAEHGPSRGSAEARQATPGTDPTIVGDVDAVQAKVTADSTQVPDALALSVIDPGTQPVQRSAARAGEPGYPATPGRAGVTARPGIFSRAQWGADESLRDGFSGYGEVHGAFVHHTVNANSYTPAQVPAMLRGIYAYHTQTRGWSDVGYNYLVDRFGRIWEGRYGGVSRPVVGAHTLNFNENSFAMSAIGNFDVAAPPVAMVRAYGRLIAWKLSLHGVSASQPATVAGVSFPTAINGHRDAAATACPGRYLYEQLSRIRHRAGELQRPWRGRGFARSLAGDARPDLLVRGPDRATVLAGDRGPGFDTDAVPAPALRGQTQVVALGDLTGDDRPDVLTVAADGAANTRAGAGGGAFRAPVPVGRRFTAATLITGAGDLDGNGVPDVVARGTLGALMLSPGRRDGTLGRLRSTGLDGSGLRVLSAAGDVDSDGNADLLAVDTRDQLVLLAGDGSGGLAAARVLEAGWQTRTLLAAGADLTGDGRADLLARVTATRRVVLRPGLAAGGFGPVLSGWDAWGVARVSVLGDVDGDGAADVLLRRRRTAAVLSGRGGSWLHSTGRLAANWGSYRWARIAGDVDGDGDADVLALSGDRMWLLRSGPGGRLASPVGGWPGFHDAASLTSVGDFDGDGRPDLMSRTTSGSAWLHPGRGLDGFGAKYVVRSNVGAGTDMIGVGRWDGDGAPDLMTLGSDGRLLLWPGNGPGGLEDPVPVATGLTDYRQLIGVGDLNRDGHADLVGTVASRRLYLLPGTQRVLGRRLPAGAELAAGALG